MAQKATGSGEKTVEQKRRAIIDAFVAQVAEKGWFALHPADLAEPSGVPLAEVHALFPRKVDLLDGLARAIDEDVLLEGPAEEAESARDRLFEVMMRRMDALQDRRPAMERLLADLPRDPSASLYRLISLPQSMAWMLETAGLESGGIEGALKVRALTVIYGLVVPVWRKDESDDLSATMKALDQRLRFAEELANSFLPSARRGGPRTEDQPTGEAPGDLS